jgi:2-dehydro-3-deoxyglucarate aldolase
VSILSPHPGLSARPVLKARLRDHALTIGSWVTLGHPAIAEIMGHAGFDWLVLDIEHSVLELNEVQMLIQALGASSCPAIARLTSNTPDQIKRVMDAGAAGIMVPMIKSVDDVRTAVQSLFYPPKGQRGVGLARAQGYGATFNVYAAWLNDNAVLIVMLEHIDVLDQIDDILKVPEVGAYIIGPYDLSASMGKPGDLDDAQVLAAIDTICDADRSAGKPGGVHVVEPNLQRLQAQINKGFTFLGYGMDVRILDSVCRRDLATIRQLGSSAGPKEGS